MHAKHSRLIARSLLGLGCSTLVTTAAAAASAGAKAGPRDIRFGPGQPATEITGEVRGDDGSDYRVSAKAGQTLSVHMTVLANPGLSFNITPLGAAEAMVIGETSNLDARVMLPADGTYIISTFLPRSAARRHESGRFKLAVALAGAPLAPLPAAQDARVAGTAYHATARIPCRWAYATAAGTCDVGVVRRSHDGTATVDIHGADGQRRRLLFVQGRLVASDSAWPMSTRRNDGRITVEIDGQERHELPDALFTGG